MLVPAVKPRMQELRSLSRLAGNRIKPSEPKPLLGVLGRKFIKFYLQNKIRFWIEKLEAKNYPNDKPIVERFRERARRIADIQRNRMEDARKFESRFNN